MKVGWLADAVAYTGGAELSLQALAAAAPEDVELISCPAGEVDPACDTYVIGNCTQYSVADLERTKPTRIKIVSDMWPAGKPEVRADLLKTAKLVMRSPLHVDRFPHDLIRKHVTLLPPPIDLERFRAAASERPRMPDSNCWLGMAFYGKGVRQLDEWSDANGPVDFYGHGPVSPSSNTVQHKGGVPYESVPAVLAAYERFVFLPTQVEPFARTVVEAWAAGCELIVNRNIGALHWIENEPAALETAAADFWKVVRDDSPVQR